jgi:4-hydroxy-tetrahydrodipicolinate reductase
MIRIALFGASGRMGRAVLALIKEESKIEIIHAIDSKNYSGGEFEGFSIEADSPDSNWDADVWVDVSLADVAYEHALRAENLGIPILIGVTGFSEEQLQRLSKLSTANIIAPNLSVGINLLLDILPKIRKTLGSNYDVAVSETHHVHKLDAPSGTAKKIIEGLESVGDKVQVSSFRMGEVVGDHKITFVIDGEQIEISHHAESRKAFARGIAPAVRFLYGKKSGKYSMRDVLGLNSGEDCS